jgi:Protein of unknown function (DUF2786)
VTAVQSDKMENLAKIKDRIAKLLRLAADSASPNEAAIAAGRARKLMDEYQLDQFDISAERLTEEFGTLSATGYYSAIPQYMSTLAVSVAKYNDCQAKYVYDTHSVHKHKRGQAVQFLGFKTDVEVAVDMYKRLLSAIDRLCKEYLTGQGYATYDVKVGGQFKTGAASAIIATVWAMTLERKLLKSEVTGTSLVLAKSKAVDEHFGEARYQDTKRRTQTSAEQRAYTQGVIEGSKVEVNRRLG